MKWLMNSGLLRTLNRATLAAFVGARIVDYLLARAFLERLRTANWQLKPK